MSPEQREAFFALYGTLPRAGPGTPRDVDWACMQADVQPDARIFDAGCGPGADVAALLAHVPRGSVLAMDTHAPFVTRLATQFGDEPRLRAEAGDMADATGQFDFIWSAGALYFLGIEDGLRCMADKLASGGTIAFSHLVYTVETPDPAVRRVFDDEPDMMAQAALAPLIERAGFKVQAQQMLSEPSWAAYYGPMRTRIDGLRPTADAPMRAVLDEAEAEIAMRAQYPDQFGYLLSVVSPR